VLQGFNSQLTMLDGRQGGGEGRDSSSGGSGEFGRSSALGGGHAFDKELDDEIPF
jgi:single-strand DNA-binding protein